MHPKRTSFCLQEFVLRMGLQKNETLVKHVLCLTTERCDRTKHEKKAAYPLVVESVIFKKKYRSLLLGDATLFITQIVDAILFQNDN